MNTFSLLNGRVQGVKFGQGRKVLAFHGLLDNAMSFALLSEHCPDLEIWAIDMPGHGLSAALPYNDGTFLPANVIALGDVIDELAWEEVIIIGHSLGGIMASLLAAVDDRIKAVFSIDSLGPLSSKPAENFERFKRVFANRNKSIPVRTYKTYDAIWKSRLKGMFPLSERAARTMAKRAVGLSADGWYHRYDRQLRQESLWRLNEEEVYHWLSQIQCPLYVYLTGAQHWPGYAGDFENREQAVPKLDIEKHEGSHHEHMEAPEKIAAWIMRKL
ncbi:alpha/beta hydrolase [Reinekea marina]|uniref:Alpha/beta fold hydrolase n=1 Tax=Reinekea marina TaxID=1310421 RepID=A0ABV7WWD4_9GAMM|nr:alpha/beta hydrolase [Reinekea marina]MDN3649054.1 alpha/beta hydrolase [Reinekea marina]